MSATTATPVSSQPAHDVLRSGINLDWWVREQENPPRLSADQVRQLASAGFTHLRVPLGPKTLGLAFGGTEPSCPLEKGALFRFLDDMRPALESNNMGLVLTIDANSDHKYLSEIAQDKSGGRLIAQLECMAQTAKRVDPDFARRLVVYSTASEPRMPAPEWSSIQKKALDVIAAREPSLFFLATPAFTTRIWDLLRLDKSSARNVGYEFHYYEPFLFTHQGVAVSFPYMRDKSNVPLGPRGVDCTAIQHTEQSTSCFRCAAEPRDDFCKEYNRQKLRSFDATFVREQLGYARKWAAGSFIYIGEYGVNKGRPSGWGATNEDRVAWLRTVSTVVKEFGFGRAHYELSCAMGITRTVTCDPQSFLRQPKFEFDEEVVRALR